MFSKIIRVVLLKRVISIEIIYGELTMALKGTLVLGIRLGEL